MVGTADSVLIREVSFIQSVLNREVPLCSAVHVAVCCSNVNSWTYGIN